MPPFSPTFLEISAALKIMRGYEFEVICNDYLKARFPNITPRINTSVHWTQSGTPDAFLFDDSGNLIAFQHGPQEDWYTKLHGDAVKVANLAAQLSLQVRLLIFCTAAEVDIQEYVSAQKEIRNLYGFQLEICDLKRLADDLEKLYPGIAFRRLGIPLPIERFMTLDDYLDSVNRRNWPKRRDLDEKKVYWPQQYIEKIENQLIKNRRCLLTGTSGSGKTVLAITFGLDWRNNEDNKRKHPEAVGFYLDASNGYSEQEGEKWFQYVRAHDYQNEIFIIDNCHLSPLAVNAFCYQWDLQQPKWANVILISAPKTSESPWEEGAEDYFESFKSIAAIELVEAEQIYEGALLTYSDAYRNLDQTRFVPAQNDLADPQRAASIQQLCSHNLITMRSVVDTWRELGGWLSDISEEAALQGVANRYLTRNKGPALIPLCNLAQFEIPAHDSYVNELPQENVRALIDENFINTEHTTNGRFHYLNIHPQVAAQIFRAYVWQQIGTDYKSSIQDSVLRNIKKYLLSKPPNFIDVYIQLKRFRLGGLQNQLLLDDELQNLTIHQSTRNLAGGITYLYLLFRSQPERARELLRLFIPQVKGLKDQALKIIKSGEVGEIVSYIMEIDAEAVSIIFKGISAKAVAHHVSNASLKTIRKWVASDSDSLTAKLGYSINWRREFTAALDLSYFFERSNLRQITNLFSWHSQVQQHIETFVSHYLSNKITATDLADIGRFIFSIKDLPKYQHTLAAQSLDIICDTDLTDCIAKSDAEAFVLLIQNAHSINPVYSFQIFNKAISSNAFFKMLSNSSVQGIKRLLYYTAAKVPSFLPGLARHLGDLDMTNQLLKSDPLEVSRLLWNVRLHLGEELAHKLCLTVDSLNIDAWINNSEREILSTFLWHLVQMSNRDELETLKSSILKERMRREWPTNPGLFIALLGAISIGLSEFEPSEYVPKIESNKTSKLVSNWMIRELKGRHPYVFALAVKGLRILNNLEPLKRVWTPSKNIPSAKFCLKLLREAHESAVTFQSKKLLEEVYTFLEEFKPIHDRETA
jgi:hypothetical protein